jgi:hypothetical protein
MRDRDHQVIIYDVVAGKGIDRTPLETKVSQADAVYWLNRIKALQPGQNIGIGVGIAPVRDVTE